MNSNDNVSPRDMLDIVFSNRNRAYGAYALRRAYPEYLGKAFVAGLLLILFSLFIPRLLRAFDGDNPLKPQYDALADMSDIRDIDPDYVPPPPPPPLPTPPPPVQATTAFVPPVVMEDNQVTNEVQQDVQQLLEDDKAIGAKNVDGETDLPPSIDKIDDFKGLVETQAKVEDDATYEGYGVQKMPSFPGGEFEMMAFLRKNIEYPVMARDNGISGTVTLSFIVGKTGQITDIAVLRDPGGGLGKEAVRVVKSMPPWIPGEANGNAVKVRFMLPVKFKLD